KVATHLHAERRITVVKSKAQSANKRGSVVTCVTKRLAGWNAAMMVRYPNNGIPGLAGLRPRNTLAPVRRSLGGGCIVFSLRNEPLATAKRK
ncbi:MAG: hypothetical protein O7C75_13520, partial [Verrucomicrobia bacterium]|nr:hypothetical protein [Verrucomicrobiota bacterium]